MISGEDIEAFAVESNDEVVRVSGGILGALEISLWRRIKEIYGEVTYATISDFWRQILE